MHLILLGGCLTLFMVIGVTTYKSEAQVVVTGKTNVPSGQIIVPFDTRQGRDTWIQLTNADPTTPVNVHIQVLLGSTCFERDFFDTLTPNDTVIYQMSDLKLNPNPGIAGVGNPFEQDNQSSSPIAVDTQNTMGVVVITPVFAANIDNSAPISHNHLAAQVHWENAIAPTCSEAFADCADFTDVLYTWNAMGRDAVLASGALAAEGTVLDGAAAFFELIQPNIFHVHYTDDFDANSSPVTFADLIMVAINDSYAAGTYSPSAGTTPTLAVDIFDDVENFSSCGNQTFTCKEVIGLNNLHPTTRTLLSPGSSSSDDGPELIADCKADRPPLVATPPGPSGLVTDNDCRVACPSVGAEFDDGYTRLRSISASSADVYFGILGLSTSNQGGAYNLHVN